MINSLFGAQLLAAATLLGATATATGSSGLKAWLEPTPRGDIIEFQGFVTASEPMLVRYSLKVLRIGRGGRSSTSQGGKVEIVAPNEPTPLSLTAINVGKDDFYEAELTATGPDGEIIRVELTHRPEDKEIVDL